MASSELDHALAPSVFKKDGGTNIKISLIGVSLAVFVISLSTWLWYAWRKRYLSPQTEEPRYVFGIHIRPANQVSFRIIFADYETDNDFPGKCSSSKDRVLLKTVTWTFISQFVLKISKLQNSFQTPFSKPLLRYSVIIPDQIILFAPIVFVSSRLRRLNGNRNDCRCCFETTIEDTESLSESLIDSAMNKFLEQVKDGSWVNGGWPQNNTDYSLSKLAVNAYTRLMAKILAERAKGQKIHTTVASPCPSTSLLGFYGYRICRTGARDGCPLAKSP
ncbi:Glucose/ribitol dehydrogenase [Artemisia annua]|uniref:Glucose/ribitol dehydrogenase n=1 Tax=Artemisia annua TaxID=35608 RepID=A0A2U1KSE7_ARTAN|nr:Glucose/ribitol dehydrogenase [Artemisia annua]